jgi:hypothetical protein
MPFYDARAIYADPILTNFSLGFQDQQYVASRLFPITPVTLPSGRYRTFDRSNWVAFPDRREPGTWANEVRGGKWSEDTFSTKQHMLQAAVDDQEIENYNAAGQNAQANLFAGIDPARDAVNLVTRSLLISYEVACANMARNAANYAGSHTTTKSGTGQWTDPGSDPMADVIAGMRAIYTDINYYPNVMIFPWDAWITLANHPKLIARYQYTQAQYDPEAALRLFTGFDGDIVVTNAVYNTADNIDTTAVMTKIWGKDVIMAKVDDVPGQQTQTYAKTFCQIFPDGNVRQAWQWREEARTSTVYRVGWRWDLKLTQALAGYLIKNAVP